MQKGCRLVQDCPVMIISSDHSAHLEIPRLSGECSKQVICEDVTLEETPLTLDCSTSLMASFMEYETSARCRANRSVKLSTFTFVTSSRIS